MAFGRRGRTETVSVTSFGEPEQITLRQLSAYDVDKIRNAYPPPLAPRKDGPDGTIIDDKDDAYRRDVAAWNEKFLMLQVCAQVVEPKFESDAPEDHVVELASSRTRDEMFDLATKAFMVGRGDVTVDHMEAAKQRLTPTESDPPADAQT